MRFLTTIAALTLASASAFAQSPFSYSVKGNLKDNAFDGKMIYIKDYNKGLDIDSVKVKGSSFEFKGKADDASFCRVSVSRSIFGNFILEAGDINVDMNNNGSTKGGALNSAMNEAISENVKIGELVKNKQKEIKEKYTDRNEQNKILSDFYDELMPQIEAKGNELFAKNNNNAVGEYLMYTDFFPEETADREKLINTFGPWLKGRKVVVKNIETINNLKKTSEGKKFIDVKGKDINGNAVALSDFVGKGDYVLVDMWASWCGPCKREIPNIAKLYNQYKGKGFNVVGIFVWDKEPNLKKAVESEKAVWPQIFDSNEVATKLYGVNGIPNIMLIGPDGTILKRGLRGEEMIKYVDELMSKK